MASIILAAGYLTYDKVKRKRAEKKEGKRKTNEERYDELRREHQLSQSRQGTLRTVGGGAGAAGTNPFEVGGEDEGEEKRRGSGESDRDGDDPSSWVEAVVRERQKSVTSGGSGSPQSPQQRQGAWNGGEQRHGYESHHSGRGGQGTWVGLS